MLEGEEFRIKAEKKLLDYIKIHLLLYKFQFTKR